MPRAGRVWGYTCNLLLVWRDCRLMNNCAELAIRALEVGGDEGPGCHCAGAGRSAGTELCCLPGLPGATAASCFRLVNNCAELAIRALEVGPGRGTGWCQWSTQTNGAGVAGARRSASYKVCCLPGPLHEQLRGAGRSHTGGGANTFHGDATSNVTVAASRGPYPMPCIPLSRRLMKHSLQTELTLHPSGPPVRVQANRRALPHPSQPPPAPHLLRQRPPLPRHRRRPLQHAPGHHPLVPLQRQRPLWRPPEHPLVPLRRGPDDSGPCAEQYGARERQWASGRGQGGEQCWRWGEQQRAAAAVAGVQGRRGGWGRRGGGGCGAGAGAGVWHRGQELGAAHGPGAGRGVQAVSGVCVSRSSSTACVRLRDPTTCQPNRQLSWLLAGGEQRRAGGCLAHATTPRGLIPSPASQSVSCRHWPEQRSPVCADMGERRAPPFLADRGLWFQG